MLHVHYQQILFDLICFGNGLSPISVYSMIEWLQLIIIQNVIRRYWMHLFLPVRDEKKLSAYLWRSSICSQWIIISFLQPLCLVWCRYFKVKLLCFKLDKNKFMTTFKVHCTQTFYSLNRNHEIRIWRYMQHSWYPCWAITKCLGFLFF